MYTIKINKIREENEKKNLNDVSRALRQIKTKHNLGVVIVLLKFYFEKLINSRFQCLPLCIRTMHTFPWNGAILPALQRVYCLFLSLSCPLSIFPICYNLYHFSKIQPFDSLESEEITVADRCTVSLSSALDEITVKKMRNICDILKRRRAHCTGKWKRDLGWFECALDGGWKCSRKCRTTY